MHTHRMAIRLVRRRMAMASPLPVLSATEIGLMTQEEFLAYRNPKGKMHPQSAYDHSLKDMNQDYSVRQVSSWILPSGKLLLTYKTSLGYFAKLDDNLVAVLHKGTLYHGPQYPSRDVDFGYTDRATGKFVHLEHKRKLVKYPQRYMPLVSRAANYNAQRLPNLLQRIRLRGEYFDIRSEKPLEKDKGNTISVLNTEGLIVASASDEWGATLLTVAREYRGQGLGKVIGELWYQWNPSYTSGGFTASGLANALRLWENRVREFLTNGWYSELVKQGKLTSAKVKKILSGLQGSRKVSPLAETEVAAPAPAKKDIRIYIDQDISFVIYDAAFLEDQNEDYIYGHGLFRDAPNIGVFLYSIDYDPGFRQLANSIALQMARDAGEDIYDGEGYSDILELEGIPNVEREGDYLRLTKDVINLRALGSKERKERRRVDPYGEKEVLLLEMADSKWS